MAKSNDPPRRVAALIRVSTEGQEEKGESLAVQTQHAIEDIKNRWGAKLVLYAGHEHATPGYERKIFDRLLHEAKQGKFDAVWVNEASRWTRDNARCAEGFNILNENRIRFFTRTIEHDLFDPQQKGFLQLGAVFNEMSAGIRKIAGFDTREARAKQNIPTCGKLPHARLFDKKTSQWSIDGEKHERIKEAAKRVLKGEFVRNLAPEFGMSVGCLHNALMKQCGDTWSFTFRRPGVDKPAVFTMAIPRLLPDSTIQKLQTKIRANRLLFHNGEPRHRYLLKGYIFCGHCGYNLYGSPNRGDRTVYRHTRQVRKRDCSCKSKSQLRAEVIEENVVRQLFEVRKNPRMLEAAMKAAIPDPDQVVTLREERKKLNKDIANSDSALNRIVASIARDTITDAMARKERERIETRKTKQEDRVREIQDQIGNVPSDDELKLVSARVYALRDMADNYSNMTWEDKRALIEDVFSTPTPDGKQSGIYITWDETNQRPNWRYEIRGVISIDTQTPRSVDVLRLMHDDCEVADGKKNRRIKQRKRGGHQSSCP